MTTLSLQVSGDGKEFIDPTHSKTTNQMHASVHVPAKGGGGRDTPGFFNKCKAFIDDHNEMMPFGLGQR